MKRPGDPGYKWPLALFLRATLGPTVRVLWRMRIFGIENIPADTGAILAGNHQSYADPVLLWCIAPRRTHFMGKSELWDNKLLGWACTRVWAFPVRRGRADRAAMRMATDFVTSGDLIGMFPEGTRNPEEGLGEAHEGVAFISMRSGGPVVPVGLVGTERIRPKGTRFMRFPRVTISFGEPIHPDSYEHLDRSERLKAMTADIMRAIAGQIDRAKERER